MNYRESVDAYAQCVRNFVDGIGAALGEDLDLLRRKCRDAWQRAESARLDLSRHELDHFCDRPDY